jgi:monofunctional biosynthetic peptidoglycan transglycosylase
MRRLALSVLVSTLARIVSAHSLFPVTDTASWLIVDDGVMGGVSSSRVSSSGAFLRFEGRLSLENNGGFASARRAFDAVEWRRRSGLAAVTALVVRARGDGRRYRLSAHVRDPMTGRKRDFVYYAQFETRADDETLVRLALNEFRASFRGRPVPDAPALVFDDIVVVGVMLADKQAGDFRLDLLEIEAVAGN